MALTSKIIKKLKDAFLDENVIIYLRNMNVLAVSAEGQEMSVSPMIEAYVVDIDEEYYYLGLPDGTITKVIRHVDTAMIELAFPADDVFNIDFPHDDGDIH